MGWVPELSKATLTASKVGQHPHPLILEWHMRCVPPVCGALLVWRFKGRQGLPRNDSSGTRNRQPIRGLGLIHSVFFLDDRGRNNVALFCFCLFLRARKLDSYICRGGSVGTIRVTALSYTRWFLCLLGSLVSGHARFTSARQCFCFVLLNVLPLAGGLVSRPRSRSP